RLEALTSDVGEWNTAGQQGAFEAPQQVYAQERRERAPAQVILEAAFAKTGAKHVEERRGERAKGVRRPSETAEGPWNDEADRRASPELVKVCRLERAAQRLVRIGERAAPAVLIDGGADPAIALDGHVE